MVALQAFLHCPVMMIHLTGYAFGCHKVLNFGQKDPERTLQRSIGKMIIDWIVWIRDPRPLVQICVSWPDPQRANTDSALRKSYCTNLPNLPEVLHCPSSVTFQISTANYII